MIAPKPTIFQGEIDVAVSNVTDGSMRLPLQDPTSADNLSKWLGRVGIGPQQTVGLMISYSDTRHYDEIATVTKAQAGALVPEGWTAADALVTTEKGCALLLPTADCYPVVLHDPVHGVLVLAHMGWQSTDADLTQKLIAYLGEHHASRPDELRVYIGPGIAGKSYRFNEFAQLTDLRWKDHLHHGELTGIDLLSYNVAALQNAGVKPEYIEVAGIDTAKDDDYFSNYASQRLGSKLPDGRFMTIAVMT